MKDYRKSPRCKPPPKPPSLEKAPAPPNPWNLKELKVTRKWLEIDFRGLPQSNPKVIPKVTFRPEKSYFWVTFRVKKLLLGLLLGYCGGDPESQSWVTFELLLILWDFGGFRGGRIFANLVWAEKASFLRFRPTLRVFHITPLVLLGPTSRCERQLSARGALWLGWVFGIRKGGVWSQSCGQSQWTRDLARDEASESVDLTVLLEQYLDGSEVIADNAKPTCISRTPSPPLRHQRVCASSDKHTRH